MRRQDKDGNRSPGPQTTGRAPNQGKQGVAVPVARLLAVGLPQPGSQGLLKLIQASGLANRSEGLG